MFTGELFENELAPKGLAYLIPYPEGWSHFQLTVNASGFSKRSRLEAELVDAVTHEVFGGYGIKKCIGIEEDGYNLPLQWKARGSRLPITRGALQARLRLTRGDSNPQLHGLYLLTAGSTP